MTRSSDKSSRIIYGGVVVVSLLTATAAASTALEGRALSLVIFILSLALAGFAAFMLLTRRSG